VESEAGRADLDGEVAGDVGRRPASARSKKGSRIRLKLKLLPTVNPAQFRLLCNNVALLILAMDHG
jgi:hypothetical protein